MTRDPGGPLRGAILLLIVGIAAGVSVNAFSLATGMRRALPWFAHDPLMTSLESLKADSGAAAWRHPDVVPVHPGATAAAPPATRPAPGLGAAPAPATQPAAVPSAHASAPSAHTAGPATRTPAPTATPAPAATAAPSPAPATPAASSPGPAADAGLPVVPESDQAVSIELATFKRFFDAHGAVIVDAREKDEYEAGHVAGALSLPYDDVVAKPQLLDAVRHVGKPIICYCSGPGCDLSKELATQMLGDGIRRVAVFGGGFPAWQAAGFPVERGPARSAP